MVSNGSNSSTNQPTFQPTVSYTMSSYSNIFFFVCISLTIFFLVAMCPTFVHAFYCICFGDQDLASPSKIVQNKKAHDRNITEVSSLIQGVSVSSDYNTKFQEVNEELRKRAPEIAAALELTKTRNRIGYDRNLHALSPIKSFESRTSGDNALDLEICITENAESHELSIDTSFEQSDFITRNDHRREQSDDFEDRVRAVCTRTHCTEVTAREVLSQHDGDIISAAMHVILGGLANQSRTGLSPSRIVSSPIQSPTFENVQSKFVVDSPTSFDHSPTRFVSNAIPDKDLLTMLNGRTWEDLIAQTPLDPSTSH